MSFIGIYLLTLLAAVLLVGCLNPNGKSLVAVCGTVALSVDHVHYRSLLFLLEWCIPQV